MDRGHVESKADFAFATGFFDRTPFSLETVRSASIVWIQGLASSSSFNMLTSSQIA
ncbi:hypothetical protein PAMC26577_14020 [Caballeronia sordidicola]|uniref:Uncharacterized protein n=1 Tax=Caballeronia sordidicola TaxID=196367 RepID=A0A242MUV3_CABSO|nr:hypothetical protein PAMC26577_14020 [Caballeronia sordidicola]